MAQTPAPDPGPEQVPTRRLPRGICAAKLGQAPGHGRGGSLAAGRAEPDGARALARSLARPGSGPSNTTDFCRPILAGSLARQPGVVGLPTGRGGATLAAEGCPHPAGNSYTNGAPWSCATRGPCGGQGVGVGDTQPRRAVLADPTGQWEMK